MSKRKDKKVKLDVRRETLRKMDLTTDQLQQVNGGLFTGGGDAPNTAPSRTNYC